LTPAGLRGPFAPSHSRRRARLGIDFTDAKTEALIWQGEGKGYLKENIRVKDEKIKEFVSKILAQDPPGGG
jgi:hypothetical protein